MVKRIIFVFSLATLTSSLAFAEVPQSRIIKSFISEDASYNGIAWSMDDCISSQSVKSSFTLNDNSITWSAVIQGGLGAYNNSDYAICWYDTDGTLAEKQTPRYMFVDCSALKAVLPVNKETMKSKTGLWKMEAFYKDEVIDNKYFYLLETGSKEISQEDVSALEERIAKNRPVATPPEPVKQEKTSEAPHEQLVVEKDAKDIAPSYEVTNTEIPKTEIKAEKKPSRPMSKKAAESWARLDKEIVGEMDKIEDLLYKRGKFYEDEKISAYLNAIEKNLMSDMNVGDETYVKVKVIRDPSVNAFSLGNGSIHITTGTLARLDNEAQLAFILAHETSHHLNKDMLHRTSDMQTKTVIAKLFDVVLAPTSVFFGILGDLGQGGLNLLYHASVTGYGRDIEARADMESMPMAANRGYEPREAATAIEVLLKERETYQKGIEIFFLMDHPSNEWRLKELNKLIAKKYNDGKQGTVGSEEFLYTMRTVKLYNAVLNMKLDRLEHARDNIRWVMEKFPANPEAHYLEGEIYRLEAENINRVRDELAVKKWQELTKGRKPGELEGIWYKTAMDEYGKAIECDPNYANSYKGLALAYSNKNDKQKAILNLQKYLELSPNAEDKRFVTSLIARLNKPVEEKKK